MNRMQLLILALAGSAIFSVATAGDDCRSVKGRVVSQVVAEFSDGSPCTSPLGICSEGRFSGNLKGRFTFTAGAAMPFGAVDGSSPGDIFATTGVLHLEPARCRGALAFRDTSVFSFGADGNFASIDTVDPLLGSGRCARASGRIRIEGIFQLGCVDCKYRGEICGLGKTDEDD